jgi:hypothetical protein
MTPSPHTTAHPNQARRWLAAASVPALLLIAGCLILAAPAGAATTSSPASLYWGAQIGPQVTGTQAPWDMSAVTEFEGVVGKSPSLIAFSAPFADCGDLPCSFYAFPTPAMENVRQYGAIPFFSWALTSSPPALKDPGFQFSDVISGAFDSYIRNFALAAKKWGHPFFLRFNWEMNGFWFPWSEGVNGNLPGEYVAAWRHVHDIFASVGATNATWVWCPNVNTYGDLSKLRPLYPGAAYVDWTCLDGFNWGDRRGSPGWLSFNQIFHSTYREITTKIAPGKPMVIGETASSDKGGSKAEWIKDTLKKLRTSYRRVRGLVWLDINDRGTHWPIESSSRKARNAFRKGIANRAYRPNLFGQISQSPISPPPAG